MSFKPSSCNKKRYKCHICEKDFASNRNLKKHIETEHEQLIKYQCNLCDKTYNNEGSFDFHMSSYHGGIKHNCDFCKKTFKNLRAHMRVVHQKIKKHKCGSCNMAFHYPKDLKMHVGAKHDQKPISCESCGKILANERTFREHTIRFHSDQKHYKCNQCEKSFGMKRDLTDHVKGVHDPKMLRAMCELCGKNFPHETRLRMHVKQRHKVIDSLQNNKCDICEKRFACDRSLKLHKKSMHIDNAFLKCDICSKLFRSKQGHDKHVTRHKMEKVEFMQCEICEKSFINKINLENHILQVHA